MMGDPLVKIRVVTKVENIVIRVKMGSYNGIKAWQELMFLTGSTNLVPVVWEGEHGLNMIPKRLGRRTKHSLWGCRYLRYHNVFLSHKGNRSHKMSEVKCAHERGIQRWVAPSEVSMTGAQSGQYYNLCQRGVLQIIFESMTTLTKP